MLFKHHEDFSYLKTFTKTFLYFQKNSDTETLAKYPVYNTDFVLLNFHCLVW